LLIIKLFSVVLCYNNKYKELRWFLFMDYREEIFSARWHLDVTKRMMVGFEEYGSKRFLVGVIRELAKCSGKLVRAFLIFDGTHGDLEKFVRVVAPRYVDAKSVENLVGILNLERDQRRARVEILKGDRIFLEIDGRWKVLKISRLREFVKSVDDILANFPTDIKR